MSEELRRQVGRLMAQQRYSEAEPVIRHILVREPNAPDVVLALAVALNAGGGLPASRSWFERAVALAPENTRVLTQFGLALHREGLFTEAIRRFAEGCTIDPDCHEAYTGLALCQRDLGDFEKAERNLRSGFMAIGRVCGRHARATNSADSPIYGQRVLGANLWVETAVFAGMFLAAEDNIPSVAMPSAESATEELVARRHRGMYYRDFCDASGLKREFLPNFFDSIREWLVGLSTYPGACLAMSTVLAHLGQAEAAEDYSDEAGAFRSAEPMLPTPP